MLLAIEKNMTEENTILDRLRAQRVLIVGLGATGLSCARFLVAQGVEVVVTDNRVNPPGLEVLSRELSGTTVFVGGFEADAFERADVLLLSPGVSLREPLVAEARARGAEILGDVELFARLVRAPVIAITGSNGKSTVTTLVGEMARAAGRHVALGGNIGVPVLDLLDQSDDQPAHDLYVLELSSFQLETTHSLETVAATILNISEDHMDRYTSLADYVAAKARVFHGSDALIVNRDDARVTATLDMLRCGRRLIHFGLQPAAEGDFGLCDKRGEEWLCLGHEALMPVARLRLRGRHNLANALAALALGQAAGLPMTAMLGTLQHFGGLPHRCQWLGEYQGVNWYNDSKATNVGAALAAINGVEAEHIVLIAGGQGKGQDFTPLAGPLAQRARAVVLLGEDGGVIEAALQRVLGADAPNLCHVQDMSEAVTCAARIARPGDAVLLSPACASFDMFSGFEQRGEVFMEQVEGQLK